MPLRSIPSAAGADGGVLDLGARRVPVRSAALVRLATRAEALLPGAAFMVAQALGRARDVWTCIQRVGTVRFVGAELCLIQV
jgi:hypothetical protein